MSKEKLRNVAEIKTAHPAQEEYAALIGLDWADEKHDICIYDTATGKETLLVIEHTPEKLAEWATTLHRQYPGQKVAICLEQRRGALVNGIIGYDFITLYPINPVSLARFRQIFSPSLAKDDPVDARLLSLLLQKHMPLLKAWKPESNDIRAIEILVMGRRNAVNQRTAITQKLQAILKEYYPQALKYAGTVLHTVMACDFLLKWPSFEDLKKSKSETIRKFFYDHNRRNVDAIEKDIIAIKKERPLIEGKEAILAYVEIARMLVEQIMVLNVAIDRFDKKIEEVFLSQDDAHIFKSVPGAGPALAPRLLVAYGSDRSKYESAQEVANYSGVAPITVRSGKVSSVQCRVHYPKFMRQTFVEHAAHSITGSAWSKAYYDARKEKGDRHHVIIRALACKWARIIFACWKNRTEYDETRYLESLKKKNPPLWDIIAARLSVA